MTRYLTLAEYLWLCEQVTGISADVLARSGRIELADSALHAPMSGFGDEDFHPDLTDKAAVLCWRLARNHPLPDGNKRAAWAALVMFVDLNGGRWEPDPLLRGQGRVPGLGPERSCRSGLWSQTASFL